ncbi:MAG TPA: DUF4147 domain-containing protein [Gemmatimonadaceae bacterium]|nr:DUF4147 domain-containing protein [Gemmatimonadaceae bacterium]
MYDAAVAGVAPGPLTTAALRSLPPFHGARVHLFALGKAAHAMASAAVAELDRAAMTVGGGVIVAAESSLPVHAAVESVVGDHPIPGRRSFAAADAVAAAAARVHAEDCALVLLSGGATSLVAAPVAGVSERDVTQLFDLLHRAGLDIHAMNVVRKRFTRWGAGRLAVALAPARTDVLLISDVPGDDPADVGSGPCTPDYTTADDVHRILADAGMLDIVPPTLRAHLHAAQLGRVPETPKAVHPAFASVSTRTIGSNRLAVAAAVAHARTLSMHAEVGAMSLEGEAARCGSAVADELLARAAGGWRGCVVWGGETTVRRVAHSGDADAALGGRCQELALAVAKRLATAGELAQRVSLLAAGTDGRDGPTDAAGAFADDTVWEAIARAGIDGDEALARHASYAALDAAQALFRRGPTGTNVMDVVIGAVA